jgi:hypothetical protein
VKPYEKCFPPLAEFKATEDENFNHSSTICRTYGAGTGIGQKGMFFKGLEVLGLEIGRGLL